MISIFGSTGFIGSHFVNKYPDISYEQDRNSIMPMTDKILYLRGTTTNYNVFSDVHKDIDTNLSLFIDTLHSAAKIPNMEFNLISSWFVNHPKGFYSATKLCQEHLLESYCKTFKQNYRILRLCNIIGGDSKASSKKNALEFLVEKLKKGEDIDIYDGDNYRNYLHIDDCCRAIKLVLDKGNLNETYEIGDIKSYRLIDMINYCGHKLNSKSNLKVIDTPTFHQIVQMKDFHMNTDKLVALGFKPEYNIWESLDLLCK